MPSRLGPTLIRPGSRGRLKLRSSNPLDAPAIYANYLADIAGHGRDASGCESLPGGSPLLRLSTNSAV